MGWFTSLLHGQTGTRPVVIGTNQQEDGYADEREELYAVLHQMQEHQDKVQRQLTDVDEGLQSLYETHIDTRKRTLSNANHLSSIDTIANQLQSLERQMTVHEKRLERCEEAFDSISDRLDRFILQLYHTTSADKRDERSVYTVPLPSYLSPTLTTLQKAVHPLTYREVAKQISKKRKTAIAYVHRLQEYGYTVKKTTTDTGQTAVTLEDAD